MYGMKTFSLGALGAALLLAGTTAQAVDRALLVGVGQYQSVSSLPGVDIDINTMRHWAPLLGFTRIEVLQNQQATYANVHAALQRLVSNLGSGDRALFYFSGHGAQFKDTNGDEADGKDEGLILYDTTLEGDEARNVLLDDEIGALIGSMKNGELSMLVDACHSGTVDKSISNRGLAPLEASDYAPATTSVVKGLGYFDIPAKNIDVVERRDPPASAHYVAISAAQDDQLARTSVNGGFFTLGLNEALKAAQSLSGITPQELRDQAAKFIQDNVKPKEYQYIPQLQGNPKLFTKSLALASSTHEHPHGELWGQLEEVLKQYGDAKMTLATDQGARVKIGQWYTLKLQLPPNLGGYLSVIAVDSGSKEATVLFPNDWAKETRFEAGATVELPPSDIANWGLKARPPVSTTLIVALVTPEPLELSEKGIRESRVDSKQKVFARLSPAGLWAAKTMRSTAAEARLPVNTTGKAAAAKVIVDFHQ